MANLHIKKGDTVVGLSGDDKGTKGEVIAVSPKEGKIMVKGANVVHKHVKPRKQGEQGGIVETEGAIYASKVALYCTNCKAGRRTKTAVTTDEKTGKSVKTRVCAKCGKKI